MKKKSNRLWWILGGIVVLMIGGLFIAKSQGWIGQPKATEVVFAKAKKTDIIEKVTASGKVQPEVEIKITPDVPGEIIELNVAEGDSVVKGQLLLKIRPDNYQSLLARAQAAVNSSKASLEQSKSAQAQAEARMIRTKQEYDRNKKLHDEKVISDADFETFDANYRVAKQDIESAKANVEAAKFNVQSAEAGLKDAAENLRKTTVYAPTNGTISKKSIELGERVVGTSQMSGTEMLRIANLNNMEVRVNVNENDIVRVNLGDSVIIDVDAYTASGRKFKGLVTEIASTANGIGGSLNAASSSADAVTEFEVKIRILRSSYADLIKAKGKKAFPFRPGMTAAVEIITDRKSGVLSVPINAVTTRNDDKKQEEVAQNDKPNNGGNSDEKKPAKKEEVKEVVFINNKGKAESRQVKTGISDFENIEIVSGLKEGEEVIAGPYLVVSKKLKNGDLVIKQGDKPKKEADKKE
ncbi:MAG: efflux RND transporter periplasmic adaptor subunit [Spirosomataceae bacterium]